MRRMGALLVLVALVAVSAACGDGNGAQRAETAKATAALEVNSDVVSHETTQDVLVFAPDAEGPWPVVVAMHGIGGTAYDMAALGTRVAREGFVVFAPTYRSAITTQEGIEQAGRDGECGYRFARSIAARYGGDLDQPVTFVGWSLGASLALALGLIEQIDPTGEFVSCFTDVPRPDVIVAVSGCHYESEGNETGFLDDIAGWGNKDADIIVVAAERDTRCAAWQSEKAVPALRSAGYHPELVMLDGATHFAPVFHKSVDGTMVVDLDAAAGEKTVEVIVDAVAARRDRR